MITRQELNIGHLINVFNDLPEDEREQARKFGHSTDIDQMIVNTFLLPGPKWGYVCETGEAVLAGGFIPLQPGTYRSWFLATNHAWGDHWRELSEIARERKEHMFASGAHRIETICLSSRKLAHRWYKTVGSTFESTLAAFCVDGTDAAMFVDIRRKH